MPQDAFVAQSIQSGNGAVDRLLDAISGVRRPFELRIDSQGIEVTGSTGLAAAWHEIADVYVLTVLRARHLVYELTPAAAAAHGHPGRGRAHPGRWHSAALLGAPLPGANLLVLDRDEAEVMAAVAQFTGGRFPSPERIWNGRNRPDILRRDMLTSRRRSKQIRSGEHGGATGVSGADL